jgi:hypothetical protein
MGKLMGPETALVTAINGIPYWYCDWRPGGTVLLKASIPAAKCGPRPPRQAIGCIVYPAEVVEPGDRASLRQPFFLRKRTAARARASAPQMLVQAGLGAGARIFVTIL